MPNILCKGEPVVESAAQTPNDQRKNRHYALVPINPSHAVISTFDADPSRREEQEFGLTHVIVPGVTQAPGFASGIWTLSQDGTTSTVVVAFADEESAHMFAVSVKANAEGQAAAGLTLLDAVVVEVGAVASA